MLTLADNLGDNSLIISPQMFLGGSTVLFISLTVSDSLLHIQKSLPCSISNVFSHVKMKVYYRSIIYIQYIFNS